MLARAIDAYQQLGIDDLIVQLEPKTTRSLERLAEALELRAHCPHRSLATQAKRLTHRN